ncbi:hypothetical protein CYY_005234 [Polysphondylium violaceum]|uniref:UbiA prenyltransferase family protein n=1 Tax=Polysphondylium violaceum TaxID=133409 RepID=A0A8J4PWX9_9MYCE|nr:hypothetical protein CYY_005234 [Polysphondylium violaceum]
MDLFLAVYYNLQPFRLKTKLFGGEICVILFYNSILNLSFFLQTGITIWTISSTSLPRIILIVWGMLVNLYVDMEDDKKDSSTANTSAIIFGETLSKYLIIGMPIITYGLTIHYAFLSGNLYTNLALLSIPQIAEVVQLALKKQKLSKPKFFKSTLMFNFLFGIGVLIQ